MYVGRRGCFTPTELRSGRRNNQSSAAHASALKARKEHPGGRGKRNDAEEAAIAYIIQAASLCSDDASGRTAGTSIFATPIRLGPGACSSSIDALVSAAAEGADKRVPKRTAKRQSSSSIAAWQNAWMETTGSSDRRRRRPRLASIAEQPPRRTSATSSSIAVLGGACNRPLVSLS